MNAHMEYKINITQHSKVMNKVPDIETGQKTGSPPPRLYHSRGGIKTNLESAQFGKCNGSIVSTPFVKLYEKPDQIIHVIPIRYHISNV